MEPVDVATKIDLDYEDDTRGGDLELVDVATKIGLDYEDYARGGDLEPVDVATKIDLGYEDDTLGGDLKPVPTDGWTLDPVEPVVNRAREEEVLKELMKASIVEPVQQVESITLVMPNVPARDGLDLVKQRHGWKQSDE